MRRLRDPLLFVHIAVLVFACSSDEGEFFENDDRSDIANTQELTGLYCNILEVEAEWGELPFDDNDGFGFPFVVMELRDHPGSANGTAYLMTPLLCDNSNPAEPCVADMVHANYYVSDSHVTFEPYSYFRYYDDSGEILGTYGLVSEAFTLPYKRGSDDGGFETIIIDHDDALVGLLDGESEWQREGANAQCLDNDGTLKEIFGALAQETPGQLTTQRKNCNDN